MSGNQSREKVNLNQEDLTFFSHELSINTVPGITDKPPSLEKMRVQHPGQKRWPELRDNRPVAKNVHHPTSKEAILAQTNGEVASPPCTDCARGKRCFKECVILPGFFNGACANCHYVFQAKKCSHYKQPEEELPESPRSTGSNYSDTAEN